MSFARVWVHLIWSTKNREKIILKEYKEKLLEHIKTNAVDKGIYIDTINCVEEHIHILILLGKSQTISDVVKLIKGESSRWWNKNKFTKYKFEWQNEYFAISVSESIVEKVRDYIRRQEEHHRCKSFSEEKDEYQKKYGSIEIKND
ncbi:MAG: IS200/IS605 family transposase [Ignavibacterium sp.]|nr:IS200/IS605 family transposase [Ignavibacterium sp.]